MTGSEGIALGEALVIGRLVDEVLFATSEDTGELTAADVGKAIETTERQLAELQRQMETEQADLAASFVFGTHILLLKDQGFLRRIYPLIDESDHQGFPKQRLGVPLLCRDRQRDEQSKAKGKVSHGSPVSWDSARAVFPSRDYVSFVKSWKPRAGGERKERCYRRWATESVLQQRLTSPWERGDDSDLAG